MASVDQRVVQMKFDNGAFERGVSTTLSTLDKLKGKLNFQGSAKGLSDISAAAGRIDLAGISRGVDALQGKFSALSVVGVTALATIANKAVNAGVSLVKSFTIAPVLDGFHQYEQQINATQTILANTSASGAKLKDVTSTLSVLNDYANKTIYNFSDMATNLGTFTSAGIKLGPAADAIQGLSNVAAAAGAGTEQASNAMYQLSQALGRGKVSAADWNSVVAAGMASSNFKTAILETAKAMGTLKIPRTETIEQYTKAGGSFQDAMQNGQITAAVLIQTLNVMKGSLTDAELAQKGYTKAQIASYKASQIAKLASEGYTKAQIKSLQAVAAQAQAAAVNVKTFSALKDNLSQGVGSAYAQVFKTLVGDLPAATVLFTKLSTILNKIFVDPVNSLNGFLVKLKSLGALKNFADGFRNIFAALGQVFKSVGDAFGNVFPPATGQAILGISKAFKSFTEGLKLGTGTAGNLRKTFEGIFSIFKIAIGIIGGVAKGFFSIFGVISAGGTGGASSLLQITAAAGEFITGLQKWLSSTGAIQTFFAVLTTPLKALKPTIAIVVQLASALASLVTGDISGFSSKISGVGAIFKSVFVGLVQSYHDFLGIFSDGLNKIGDFFTGLASRAKAGGNSFVAGLAGGIASVSRFLADITSKIRGYFSGILGSVQGAGSGISGFLSRLSDQIRTFVSSIISSFNGATATGKGFLSGFASGAIAGVLVIMKKLGDVFQNLKEKFNFGPQLDGVNSQAGSFASGGGNALAKIGGVIAAIWKTVTSIFTGLGKIIGPFLRSLGDFFGTIAFKIKEYIKKLDVQDAVALLNTGFFILLYKNFSSFLNNFGGAAKSFGGIFSNLGGALKSFQNAAKASIILQIGLAVAILVSALFILAKIDAKALGIGIGALGVLFAQIAILFKVIKKIEPTAMFSAGAGMVAIAIAVLVLAGAIKILGSLDPKVLTQGAIAIGVIMAALAGMATVLNGLKGVFVAAAGLLILAAALTAISGAIVLYAKIPFNTVTEGLKRMGLVLLVLGLTVDAFPPGMIATSIGIGILAGALVVLSVALAAIGFLPIPVIIKGLAAISIALLILAVAAAAMETALPGAVAMVLMAGAIAVLSVALKLLGSLPIEVIGKGLLAIAALMLIFVGAMYLLAPVILIMAAFSSSLLILGLAILAAGVGFGIFVGALGALTVIGAAGFAILGAGIITLINIFPLLAQQMGYALLAFLAVIRAAAPKVALTAGVLLISFVDEIAKRYPQILDAGLRMITGFLKSIRNHIGEITGLAIDIYTKFLVTLSDHLPGLIRAGIRFILTFVNGLADGIRASRKDINAAAVNLGSAIIEGLVSGIGAGYDAVIQAAKDLAKQLPYWARKVLGVNSPSTVFADIGMYSAQGLALGLDKHAGVVKKSATNVGDAAVSSLKKSLKSLSGITAENMDIAPTIRPVFDMTGLKKDSALIGNMLDVKPLNVNATFAKASFAATGYNNNQNTTAASTLLRQNDIKALSESISLSTAKSNVAASPRPVEFHIGTIQDGDSLLRRARATNKMLSLAEGGDSTQMEKIL